MKKKGIGGKVWNLFIYITQKNKEIRITLIPSDFWAVYTLKAKIKKIKKSWISRNVKTNIPTKTYLLSSHPYPDAGENRHIFKDIQSITVMGTVSISGAGYQTREQAPQYRCFLYSVRWHSLVERTWRLSILPGLTSLEEIMEDSLVLNSANSNHCISLLYAAKKLHGCVEVNFGKSMCSLYVLCIQVFVYIDHVYRSLYISVCVGFLP